MLYIYTIRQTVATTIIVNEMIYNGLGKGSLRISLQRNGGSLTPRLGRLAPTTTATASWWAAKWVGSLSWTVARFHASHLLRTLRISDCFSPASSFGPRFSFVMMSSLFFFYLQRNSTCLLGALFAADVLLLCEQLAGMHRTMMLGLLTTQGFPAPSAPSPCSSDAPRSCLSPRTGSWRAWSVMRQRSILLQPMLANSMLHQDQSRLPVAMCHGNPHGWAFMDIGPHGPRLLRPRAGGSKSCCDPWRRQQ